MQLITNVVITNLKVNKQVKIDWSASTTTAILGYKVYRSAVPYANYTLVATVGIGVVTYTDTPKLLPYNEWYYKVVEYDITGDGPSPTYGSTYIDELAFVKNPLIGFPDFADLPLNDEMKYYFDTIRTRDMYQLQNDGETMTLYKRKYEGTPCSNYVSEDGQCRAPLASPACYGTGFVGGYYDPLDIMVRIHDVNSAIQIKDVGYRLDMKPRMWTIWVPRIRTGDFLVTQENKRYEVVNTHAYTWRGMITHQDFEVVLKAPNDIIYRVGS